MTAHKDITELIGRTPLVRLNRLSPVGGATIYGKVEFFNPGGSVKDRICLNMINEAERLGTLKPGGTIVEATSGNTGIGLALVAAVRGYKLILVMPESMSMERASLLSSYGAQLVLTPAWEGMKGSIREVESIIAQNPSYFMPDQFSNPANPAMHKKTTAIEILEALDGKIDAFVAAVGTGGTITGCGELFKEGNPSVLVIAVEPAGSPVLSGGEPGPHKIQGIGAGFIPKVLNGPLSIGDDCDRRRGLSNGQAENKKGRALGGHFRRGQCVRRTESGSGTWPRQERSHHSL
jgi:cysteine synthase A